MQKYLSFTVGGLNLGVDMTSVVSIEQGGALPGEKPGELELGTVSYGGQEVPLYNGSLLMGGRNAPPPNAFDSKILIVRAKNGAIALSVDRVGSVMEVAETALSEVPPVFTGMARASFPTVLRGPAGLIPLVSPDAVAPAALTVQMKRLEAEAAACQPPVADGPFAEPEACGEIEAAELLGAASPVVLGEPAAEVGLEAMAGLDAEPDVFADHEAPVSPASECEALGAAFPAVVDVPAVDMGFEAMADLAAEPLDGGGGMLDEPMAELGGEPVADVAFEPGACAEGEADAGVTPGRGCFVYVEPSDEELSLERQEAAAETADCVNEHDACIGGAADVEVPVVAVSAVLDEPVIDLVDLAAAPLPEAANEALDKEGGARLQEKEILSKLMEKAITPDLLEKVVDRVVISMMTELVSDLTSDALEKRDASHLY